MLLLVIYNFFIFLNYFPYNIIHVHVYNSYKMIANKFFVDVTNDVQHNTHRDMLGMSWLLMCYLAHGR